MALLETKLLDLMSSVVIGIVPHSQTAFGQPKNPTGSTCINWPGILRTIAQLL